MLDRTKAREIFTSIGWGHSHQCNHIFDFTMQAAEEASGGVVLDAGAGFQACRPFFSDALYLAQEHPDSGAMAKNITEYDILCDAMTIPLLRDTVRLVFSNVCLEHMRYPEPFFHEAYRVLEPGGALYIHCPFIYMEHEKPFDFQRVTSFGLKRWYEDAGFERVTVEPTSSSIMTSLWALNIALQEEMDRGFASKAATLKARVLRFLTTKLGKMLGAHFDRGPFDGVQFNIGWTAKGYKKGEREGLPLRLTKKQFLEQKSLPGVTKMLTPTAPR